MNAPAPTPPPAPASQPAVADLARQVLLGSPLSREDATTLFGAIAAGELSDVTLAGLLVSLRGPALTAQVVAGAAAAFIAQARLLPVNFSALDSCGTGGDHAGTINISTAAALTAASCGVRVAKHGNRSVSSQSGSADVLEQLGIPTDFSPAQAASLLELAGFTFLFAPLYHPAIARVMPVRRELRIPTVFNLLGPLLNPAPISAQLVGVADLDKAELVANSLAQLGREHALVVHGSGLDEIALHGPTQVWEVRGGEVSTFELTPADLGLPSAELSALVGGDPGENAAILRQIFAGAGTAAQTAAVAANTGALLYLDGQAPSLRAGVDRAQAVLASGQVTDYLEKLVAGANALGHSS